MTRSDDPRAAFNGRCAADSGPTLRVCLNGERRAVGGGEYCVGNDGERGTLGGYYAISGDGFADRCHCCRHGED